MLEVERLTKSHIEYLYPIIKEYKDAHSDLNFRTEYLENFIQIINELLDNDEKMAYIAKYEGKVVGLIIGMIESNSRLELPNEIGYIGLLTVLKDYRRKGIGKELVDKLKDWFKEKKITEIELFTTINNEESRRFWDKSGYKVYLERRKINVLSNKHGS